MLGFWISQSTLDICEFGASMKFNVVVEFTCPSDGSLGKEQPLQKAASSLMSQPESPHGTLRVQYRSIHRCESSWFTCSVLFLRHFPSCIQRTLFLQTMAVYFPSCLFIRTIITYESIYAGCDARRPTVLADHRGGRCSWS